MLNCWIFIKLRMHSSRMRTARGLTVSQGACVDAEPPHGGQTLTLKADSSQKPLVMWEEVDPSWTDKHLWKHYLLQTPYMSCNRFKYCEISVKHFWGVASLSILSLMLLRQKCNCNGLILPSIELCYLCTSSLSVYDICVPRSSLDLYVEQRETWPSYNLAVPREAPLILPGSALK